MSKRSIRAEIQVPGTPEQVWEAIATGPGIAAWFAPAEFEPRAGAPIAFDMGAGMEASGEITTYEPPRRFAYAEEWEGAPWATEWLVEAQAGGTCVVRLVSSVFGAGDWSDELDQMREGWESYLQNLRVYLTHFPGLRCAWIMVRGEVQGTLDDAQAALVGGLGLPAAAVGERIAAGAPGAPALAGVVAHENVSTYHRDLMLVLDDPAPGTAFLFSFSHRGQTFANVHAYLYGDGAEAVVADEAPKWRAWMAERVAGAPVA
jgi:uncharacterized protein YndB with AHSA1/START domain